MPLSKEPVNIFWILRQSWRLYRANFSTFIGITALGASLSLLEGLLDFFSKAIPSFVFLITGLSGMFLSTWASIALVIAISQRSQDETMSVTEAFRATKGKYWRYIRTFIVYILILVAGFLLLVIPSLY